jgi:hypothetical protein
MSQSILIAAGAVVALVVLVPVVLVLRDPGAATRRVEALFRRPRAGAKKPGPGHYYKTYWS